MESTQNKKMIRGLVFLLLTSRTLMRVKTHDKWNVECLHQIRLIARRQFTVEKKGFGWLIRNGSIWMPGEINLLPFFAAKVKKREKKRKLVNSSSRV